MNIRHTALYLHFVDIHNTTNGGLPKKPQKVEYVVMEKTEYFEIGSRLALIRQRFSDLSQAAWAEKHGFTPTQYNNWEKGVRRITVDEAERLADMYDLTLDYIYRGKRAGLAENLSKSL